MLHVGPDAAQKQGKARGKADLLVSMGSQDFGPQLQAVDGLPAVHLPEALLATHRQSTPQQHCQLADACSHTLELNIQSPHETITLITFGKE